MLMRVTINGLGITCITPISANGSYIPKDPFMH